MVGGLTSKCFTPQLLWTSASFEKWGLIKSSGVARVLCARGKNILAPSPLKKNLKCKIGAKMRKKQK